MALFDLKPIHNGGFSYLAMPKRQFFEVLMEKTRLQQAQ